MHRARLAVYLVAISLVAGPELILARGKPPRVDSAWRVTPIAIDGSGREWQEPLSPFADKPLFVGVLNDGEFLYLRLRMSSPVARRQLMMEGLTVWFDGEGGDKKRVGIRYPLPTDSTGRRGEGRRGLPGPDGGGAPADRSFEPPRRLEVLGSRNEDTRSYMIDQAPGISVKIGQEEGALVYELQIPLARTDVRPHAVGARPGSAVGIGLDVPKVDVRGEAGRGFGGGGMGGVGRGGGRIGGRGVGGGRGRGGAAGGGFRSPEAIKGWIVAALATPR